MDMEFLPDRPRLWLAGRFAQLLWAAIYAPHLDDKGHCLADTAPARRLRRFGAVYYGGSTRNPSAWFEHDIPACAAAAQRAVAATPPNERNAPSRAERAFAAASASGRISRSGRLSPSRCLSSPAWRVSACADGANAAALRVADQRVERSRRARHADPHRILDAEIAQPHHPADEPRRRRSKIG